MRYIALLALCVAVLGGCQGTGIPNPFTSLVEYTQTTTVKDDSIVMDVAGPVAIDVEAFNGNIRIVADDRAEGVSVRLTRVGTHGWTRNNEGKETLAAITLDAEIVPGELDAVVQIRAATDDPEPHFQRADLEIIAPEISGVKVRTGIGDVTVRGAMGTADVVTEQGTVIYASNHAANGEISLLVNDQGHVYYRTRGETAADFDCHSNDGDVQYRVSRGSFRLTDSDGVNRMHGVLNEGGNPVFLRTNEGNIRISVVESPEEYGMYIIE